MADDTAREDDHEGERIADEVGTPVYVYSERTLQRCVQRTLGTSPIRFVQDLRIERASHLLHTTDLSLETIARRVGYEHANSAYLCVGPGGEDYLTYAASTELTRFGGWGHARIGLARSNDLAT